MDSKKIGAFLKNLRNKKGLTQEQLAEVLGVSGRTVSRWETGSNVPDLRFVIGESTALIIGGIAYIGIMIHNGLWDIGTPWRNTWKSDVLVSAVCAMIFGLAYALFLCRAGATYTTIVQWTVGFWIGITALAFIVLRIMAYKSKKMHQCKTDENGYRKNEEPAIVKVYNAKDIVTAQILKDLLKEENVEVFVQNSGSEVAGHSTPGFGIYGVDIYTTEDNAEKAVKIIRQYHDGISE